MIATCGVKRSESGAGAVFFRPRARGDRFLGRVRLRWQRRFGGHLGSAVRSFASPWQVLALYLRAPWAKFFVASRVFGDEFLQPLIHHYYDLWGIFRRINVATIDKFLIMRSECDR
jgi:hypothetical protein